MLHSRITNFIKFRTEGGAQYGHKGVGFCADVIEEWFGVSSDQLTVTFGVGNRFKLVRVRDHVYVRVDLGNQWVQIMIDDSQAKYLNSHISKGRNHVRVSEANVPKS